MATLKIIAGTVYGNAQHVAEQVEENLAEQGVDCELESDPSVSDFTDADAILVITSTTGQGDIPPNLEFVFLLVGLGPEWGGNRPGAGLDPSKITHS